MKPIDILRAVVFLVFCLGLYHRIFYEAKLAFTEAEFSLLNMTTRILDVIRGTTAAGSGALVSLLRRFPHYVMQLRGYTPTEELRQYYPLLATIEVLMIFLAFPIVLRQNRGRMAFLWSRFAVKTKPVIFQVLALFGMTITGDHQGPSGNPSCPRLHKARLLALQSKLERMGCGQIILNTEASLDSASSQMTADVAMLSVPQEHKWGASLSEVAQGLIALHVVLAALVLALVCGFILHRLVLSAVQYMKRIGFLFRAACRGCRSLAHALAMPVRGCISLVTRGLAYVDLVTKQPEPNQQNPQEPSAHVATSSSPVHLPSSASPSEMDSSMTPSSPGSPLSPLVGFRLQRDVVSTAPSADAPCFQHQLPGDLTPAQQQCIVDLLKAQQLHYEARLCEEVSQQVAQHEGHEEEVEDLQRWGAQEQQWRQEELAYAQETMNSELQIRDMQLADQRQQIADQQQQFQEQVADTRQQLADQQQSSDEELTERYQQVAAEYAEELAEKLARQRQLHANALNRLRQHVLQLLASLQAERQQLAAIQQEYSQALAALVFERESREAEQAQSTAQVQQLADKLDLSQNLIVQKQALFETFCLGPTGYYQLQADLAAAVQNNADLREHNDVLTQSNALLTEQAEAMRDMQHPVYRVDELLLADMHGSLGTNPISSGTFGTVESTCTGHLGPVVCKWVVNLDEEAAKALDVEAGNLASFRHPSIVAYYGRVVDPILRPSQMGIVMECMDSTLCPLITAGSLVLDQVVDIGLQLSAGLHFLHQRGCMHGDLKPNNIGVSPVGGRLVAKLLDAGSFRQFPPGGAGSLSWGVPGQMPLVDAYAPPEYFLGRLVGDTEYMLDPKVEVFVWGLILADMLGVPRLDTLMNGPLEDFVQRMAIPPYQVMWPDASQVPDPLRLLVESCLAYHSVQRPTMLAVTAGIT